MPITDEQLEAAEQRLDSDPIDCPPDLQDPYALFSTAEAATPKAKRRSLLSSAFHEEAGTLRYAARKGQSIPDDVRAKMRKDGKEADNQAQTSSSAKED